MNAAEIGNPASYVKKFSAIFVSHRAGNITFSRVKAAKKKQSFGLNSVKFRTLLLPCSEGFWELGPEKTSV